MIMRLRPSTTVSNDTTKFPTYFLFLLIASVQEVFMAQREARHEMNLPNMLESLRAIGRFADKF